MFRKTLFMLLLVSVTGFAADSVLPPDAAADELPSTLVTLHLKDAPFRTAMEKVLETTQDSPPAPTDSFWKENGEKTVTLDLDHAPFWEAMRQLCEQTGMSPEFGEAGLIMTPDHGEWAARPHVIAGPFLIQAIDATVIATARLGREPTFDPVQCELHLNVLAERNASAIRINGIDLEEVADDAGDSIPLPNARLPFYSQFHNRSCAAGIHLEPEPSARAIAHIKGTIAIVVETSSARLEFAGIRDATEAEQQVGPLRCKIKAKLVENSCELAVEFTDPRKDPDLWEMTWKNLRANQPVLTDAGGRPFAYGGSNEGGSPFTDSSTQRFVWQSPNGLKDRPQQPFKLSWRIPTGSRIVKVPFEFRNLPLPNHDVKSGGKT